MIRQSLYFTFNGETSEDYGIYNVNMSTGMQSEPFAAPREIREVSIRGTSKRYFQDLQLSPLEFTVSFAFKETFSSDHLRSVARWLTSPNFYAPLQFFDGEDDSLNPIYYAMFIDTPELVTNMLNQGYVNLKVRCFDGYAYSGIYTSEIYDYTSNPSEGTIYIFENGGDEEVQPIILVQIVSGNGFTITNYSNGSQKFGFSGLTTGEILTIDCENNIIESNLGNPRYDNITSGSQFLSIPRGKNTLNIQGNVRIQWTYEFKYIVG